MTLIDELRSRASTTADDDVEFIEQTLVWKAADRIAELEEMLRRVLADEWTVLVNDIEDAIRDVLAEKA